MPEIPNVGQTGYAVPRSERPVASYAVPEVPISPIHGIAKAIGEYEDKKRDENSKFQLAKAKADFLSGLDSLDAKYQNDTDFSTLHTRYVGDLKNLSELSGAGISDPVYKEQWGYIAQESIAEKSMAMRGQANKLHEDTDLSIAIDGANKMDELYKKTGDIRFLEGGAALISSYGDKWGKQSFASEKRKSFIDGSLVGRLETSTAQQKVDFGKRFSINPEGGRNYKPAGDWVDSIDPEVVLKAAAQGQAELDRIGKDSESIVTSFKERLKQGFPITAEEAVALEENIKSSGSLEAAKKFDELMILSGDLNVMRQSSPLEISNFVTSLSDAARKSGVRSETVFERIKFANQYLDTARTKVKQNPMQYATEVGTVQSPQPLSVGSDVKEMAIRDGQATSVYKSYGRHGYYNEDELNAVSSQLEKMNPDEKISFYKNLRTGAPKNYVYALAQIGEKTSLNNAYLAGLALSSPGNEATARYAMSGLEMLKVNGAAADNELANDAINSKIAALENYFTVSPDLRGILFDTTKALVASGKYKEYPDALNAAIGSEIDGDTILPVDVTSEEWSDFIQNSTLADFVNMSENRLVPVRANGQFVSVDDMNDPSRYRMVGPGKYHIYDKNDLPVFTTAGIPYTAVIGTEEIKTSRPMSRLIEEFSEPAGIVLPTEEIDAIADPQQVDGDVQGAVDTTLGDEHQSSIVKDAAPVVSALIKSGVSKDAIQDAIKEYYSRFDGNREAYAFDEKGNPTRWKELEGTAARSGSASSAELIEILKGLKPTRQASK